MIKYTNNEQYELDKVKFIADIERFAGIQKILHGTPVHHEAEELTDLLKQSKWIGSGDVDNSVLPIPVKKDGNGKFTKDYTTPDWFIKLDEELNEVKNAAIGLDTFPEQSDLILPRLIEELQDLITVCTSYLDFLDCDEEIRKQICYMVNEKNRQRGYFEET